MLEGGTGLLSDQFVQKDGKALSVLLFKGFLSPEYVI